MKKYILTVGPSLLGNVPLTEIHSEKNIYRINGAHGSIVQIEDTVKKIRSQVGKAPILIDLPGNKIRTKLSQPIAVTTGEEFVLSSESFNYPDYYQLLQPGMVVWANDSVFRFIVQSANSKEIVFHSESTGLLQNGKGMHVRGIHDKIPFLFEKDRELIELCNRLSIEYVGLSFVRTAQNIREAKALLNSSIEVVSKVETEEAVHNLIEILNEVSTVLVDRGDLSTEIGLYKIPAYQKHIIETALYNSKKVFLATQVLKNMEHQPIPTIAEIDDLYTIMKMGVYGLQLSEETAVGDYVQACVQTLEAMHTEIASQQLPY